MTAEGAQRISADELSDPLWLDVKAAKELLKSDYRCPAKDLDSKLVTALTKGQARIAYCGPAWHEPAFSGDEPDTDGFRYDLEFYSARLPETAAVTINGNHVRSDNKDLLKARIHKTSLEDAMSRLNKKIVRIRRPGAGRNPAGFPWEEIENALRVVWAKTRPSSFEKLCLEAMAMVRAMPGLEGKKLPDISTAQKRFGKIYSEWKHQNHQ